MRGLDDSEGVELTLRSLRLALLCSEEIGVSSENSRLGAVEALDSEYPDFYQVTMVLIISSEALIREELYLALRRKENVKLLSTFCSRSSFINQSTTYFHVPTPSFPSSPR